MKYSIGKFSEFFGVTSGTLRHYDKIGLLKPEVDLENGYRYYNMEHILQLDFILKSKSLGMSLTEIKEILASENLLKYVDLLDKQQKTIREQITYLKELDKSISKSKYNLNKVVDFHNDYNFENMKILNDTKRYYYVNVKDCTENSKIMDIITDACVGDFNKSNNNDEEEFCIYNIKDDNYILASEEYVLLRETPEIKRTLDSYFLSKYGSIPIKEISGNHILINFYGSEEELKNYILLLHNHFKGNYDEVFAKLRFCLPKKEESDVFWQILYQL